MFKVIDAFIFIVCVFFVFGATDTFAQFGGRGGIFGRTPRNGRGDRGYSGQDQTNHADLPPPDLYQQTQHRLMVLEVELQLQAEQQEAWRTFSQKVLAYASDLSRDRARAGVPEADQSNGGLQRIDTATAIARSRVTELEEIGTAAKALYATLSPDQKKVADKEISAMIAPGGSMAGDR